jgi:hypothetical protein
MPASIVSYGGVSMDEAEAIAPGLQASQTPTTSAPAPAAETVQDYANAAVADINAGNYAGALQEGLDSGKLYGTNYGAVTKDPLLADLETSSGLEYLDPSKKWTPQAIKDYYAAFQASPVWQQSGTKGQADSGESWGKNIYGLWGDVGKLQGDAATNIATAGDNTAPDLQRFAGARPTKSFLGKYGADIAALAATIVTWGAASPLLAAAVGAGAEIAANAAEGNPTTLGSVGKDIAVAAVGSLVPGVGEELGAAAGIGTTLGTAVAGAGAGAINSGIMGGNVGMGAAIGGVGGAVSGSNIAGTASGDLQSAGLGSTASNIISKVGVGLATGAVDQEIGSELGGHGGNVTGVGPASSSSSAGAQSPAGTEQQPQTPPTPTIQQTSLAPTDVEDGSNVGRDNVMWSF